MNGYLAILIGCAITVFVQSSSITTSALIPFVGMGALHLEQMFPLTLGANIGTTVTGILASLVSNGTDALQVALCQLFFNITGIIIWYPVPFMRKVPLNAARTLGATTRIWRGFPIVYILVVFVAIPLLLFGLSALYNTGSKGFTVLAAFITSILILLLVCFCYKWHRGGLKERTYEGLKVRERKRETMATLPGDIDYIKAELARLRDHTGLPEHEEE